MDRKPFPKRERSRAFSIIANTVLFVVSLAFIALVLEFGTRFLLGFIDEEAALRIKAVQEAISNSKTNPPRFTPHPYLSYHPSDVQLTESGCVIDGESFDLTPPSNTFRIACLGGSTTMRAYPDCLAESLQPCFPDKRIEVMDWGCSGWTILESTLNYCIRGRLFHPDLVIVHHGVNDVAPRFRSNYAFDYSHYRKSAQNFEIPEYYKILDSSYFLTWLFLRVNLHPVDLDTLTVHPVADNGYWPDGKIPEKTNRTYREALDAIGSLCKADEKPLLLAGMIYNVTRMVTEESARIIREHNSLFEDYAASHGFRYVDLQNFFQFHKEFFVDEAHLNPWGDAIKSNCLANAISKIEGASPRIWVTDNTDSSEDLVGGKDEDPEENRELVIHWDSIPEGTTDVHLYVNVDGESDRYLGNVLDVERRYLSWKPEYERISNEFRSGPQFGRKYTFGAWFVNPEYHMPLVTDDWVSFQKAPEVNLEP